MTDTAHDSSSESTTDQPARDADSRAGGGFPGGDVWRVLAWGGLAICSLLAFFAVIQFYGSVTDAIDLWVEPRHQPVIHAAFNLVVLCGSLIGISVLVRELR